MRLCREWCRASRSRVGGAVVQLCTTSSCWCSHARTYAATARRHDVSQRDSRHGSVVIAGGEDVTAHDAATATARTTMPVHISSLPVPRAAAATAAPRRVEDCFDDDDDDDNSNNNKHTTAFVRTLRDAEEDDMMMTTAASTSYDHMLAGEDTNGNSSNSDEDDGVDALPSYLTASDNVYGSDGGVLADEAAEAMAVADNDDDDMHDVVSDDDEYTAEALQQRVAHSCAAANSDKDDRNDSEANEKSDDDDEVAALEAMTDEETQWLYADAAHHADTIDDDDSNDDVVQLEAAAAAAADAADASVAQSHHFFARPDKATDNTSEHVVRDASSSSSLPSLCSFDDDDDVASAELVSVGEALASRHDEHNGSSSSSSTTTTTAKKYEHTSATLGSINRRDAATAAQWVTRSTKEYMAEVDRSVAARGSSKSSSSRTSADGNRRGNIADAKGDVLDNDSSSSNSKVSFVRRALTLTSLRQHLQHNKTHMREVDASLQAIHANARALVERELAFMANDKRRRIQKLYGFVLRRGRAFMCVYLGLYFGMLALLYTGFASGLVRKDAVYEYLFVLINYTDRERFFERVASWDTYVNVGFAFVINEAMEPLRLPLAIILYYELRPMLLGVSRYAKASMFRLFAAES